MRSSDFFLSIVFAIFILPVFCVSWFFNEVHVGAIGQFFLFGALLFWLGSFVVNRCVLDWLHFSSQYSCLFLVLIWLFGAFFASCLFHVYGLNMAWVDAFFVSVSGITTTGADVLDPSSPLPLSLSFYRMWLQFLGGLGIVLMAVTAFSSGGGRLARGVMLDLPGPLVSYSKKKPKLSQLTHSLWGVYAVATLLCVFVLKTLGLDWFESICESLSIISTGGFTLYADGLGHYHSSGVKWMSTVFMLFSAVNFLLHYQFFILREYGGYTRNQEMKNYALLMVCMVGLFMGGCFFWNNRIAMVDIVFMVVSALSSSGFVVVDLSDFPVVFSVLLVFLGMIGGMSGSTSGGIKVIRFRYLCQEVVDACRLLKHPRVILSNPARSVGMSGSSIDSQVVMMRGFLTAFVGFFVTSLMVLTGMGIDFHNAFFSTCACLSNTGLFWGRGVTLATFSDQAKLWLSFLMLIGRVEILTFLVAFSPRYWMGR